MTSEVLDDSCSIILVHHGSDQAGYCMNFLQPVPRCASLCHMNRVRARPSTTVPIDGQALRRLRIDRGIEVADLAARIQVSRPYLTKLELGHSPRCSPTVHAALVRILKPEPRDALRSDRATV